MWRLSCDNKLSPFFVDFVERHCWGTKSGVCTRSDALEVRKPDSTEQTTDPELLVDELMNWLFSMFLFVSVSLSGLCDHG